MSKLLFTMEPAKLFFNGAPLSNPGVGIGAYGIRLLELLLERRTEIRFSLNVLAPDWMPLQLPPDAQVMRFAIPRTGIRLLDQMLWSQRLGAVAARRKAVLFSPGPFWSPCAPKRAVVCHHDRIYHYFPRYLGRTGLRKWLAYRAELFLPRCAAVITESQHAKQDLTRIPGVDSQKIHVIRAWLPEGFNPARAAAKVLEVRSKYRLPADYWLYVGGFDYRKNVELLLEAYAVEAECNPPLVLAGRLPSSKGPYCDIEGTMKRTGLDSSKVFFPGFVANEDMAGLYGGASLFIYPSLYEGFGLPPMEAMGCGCTAICADNSSLPEVVRDASHRFETRAPEPLVELLRQARAGRLPFNPSFSREDFSETKAAEDTIRVLNEVAAMPA
jgi:glycosyltransferase involved in cell wall biosynthesis